MKFSNILPFHKTIRKIPAFIAVVLFAVIAAIMHQSGHAHGMVLAGSILMSRSNPMRRFFSKARKMKNIDLEFISILTDNERPANDLPVIVKSVNGNPNEMELQLHLVKKDVSKGLLYATSYEPGKEDLQGDMADAEEIQKMAYRFLQKGIDNIDTNHNLKKNGSSLAESFLLRGEDPMFPNIAKGAHCVVIQLSDTMKKNASKITGVSIFGHCDPSKSVDSEEIVKGNGAWLRTFRVDKKIGDTEMSDILGTTHDEYLQIESEGGPDYEFTPDVLKAIAKRAKEPLEVVMAAALNNGKAPATDPNADPNANPPADPNAPAPPAGKSVHQTDPTMQQKIAADKKVIKARAGQMLVPGATAAGQTAEQISKSIEESRIIVYKALTGFTDIDGRICKDITEAGFVDVGGVVKPQYSDQIITILQSDSGFLKQAQVVQMSSLKEDVPILGIGTRKMRRYPVRDKVANASLITNENLSRTLSCSEFDSIYNLADNVRLNYGNRLPQLESIVGQSMMGQFNYDLEDLAFHGETDTYNSAASDPFVTLAVGYFVLARANASGGQAWRKVDASVLGYTEITESWDEAIRVMAANNKKYAKPTTAFVIGPEDFERYESELTGHPGAFNVIVDGAKGSYRGHPVFVVDSIEAGNWIYTPMKNFVVGIVTQGASGIRTENKREFKSTDYMLTAAGDFDFVDETGVVVGQP